MAKHDEIHSTERLLELIRSRDPDEEPPQDPDAAAARSGNAKTLSLAAPLSFQKRINVGVDIGHTYIKLAKLRKGADGFELLDYLDVPLAAPVTFKDSNFRRILKSSLDRFCGNAGKYRIWGAIGSADVEIRCITIPKIPRKQVANAVFWTFTKKVAFNQATELLDYDILGDTTEDGVKKTEIVAFKAPREDVDQLKATFRQIGYPLNGITIVPFAIQNLFRTQIFPPREQNVCSLFVGRDWSRIAIFNNGSLILSRGIRAGMRSMVESINIALRNRNGWDQPGPEPTADASPAVDDAGAGIIDPAAQKLFFDFLQISGRTPVAPDEDPGVDMMQVFQMLMPAVERLVRQIERTLDHYALKYRRDKVRRIYLSGRITASGRLVEYIGQQLELPVEILDPFPAQSGFTHNVRIPDSASLRESYAPAIGIALSRNSLTPNFLFTHQSKEQAENVRKNNMRVLTACMLCLIGLIAYFSWQERRLDAQRATIEKINAQMLAYNPPADKELILGLYAQAKNKRQVLQQITRRYAPVATLNELARITPSSVRLLTVDMRYDTGAGKGRQMIIEGIIFSEPGGLETALTSYLYGLRNSPLFSRPNVVSKRTEFYNNQEVLWFSARLELTG